MNAGLAAWLLSRWKASDDAVPDSPAHLPGSAGEGGPANSASKRIEMRTVYRLSAFSSAPADG